MTDEIQPDPSDAPEPDEQPERSETPQEEVQRIVREIEQDPARVRTETPPEEPLRNRSETVQGVPSDEEPIATHKVSRDSATVTDEYHNPGQARENEQDDSTSAEFVAERDELEAKAAAGDGDIVERFVPPLIDTRSPETAYATKDNIVHPGPLGDALLAERVAQDALPGVEGVRVEIDPTLVTPEDGETAAEVLERAREEVVTPDEPKPVTSAA